MTAPSIDERLAAAGLPPLPRPAWLEIDEEALAGNVRAVRSLVGASVEVAAVVKADGYGHGIEVAARSFLRGGAGRLCVATLDEAFRLRAAGISAPIVVLFSIPPEAVIDAVASSVELVAADVGETRRMLAVWTRVDARRRPTGPLRLHLEIESGLGRAGVPAASAAALAAEIIGTPATELVGLWSHLARPEDAAFSARQEEPLERVAAELRAAGVRVPPRHLAASGGLYAATGPAFELVRPGLALYGELDDDLPIAEAAALAATALRPAMALKARPLRIIDVPSGTPIGYGGRWVADRPSRIATLPVGYGDGWARASSPGSSVLVRGVRAPLVGTVAMDAVAADVTDLPGVDMADEFVLLGAQGSERITATELARRRTTIPWEILTSMAYRLPRVYDAGARLTGVRTLAGEVLAVSAPESGV